MHIERFRNEFNRLNGVYATDQVVLFRNPLELYDMKTGNVIAQFDSLEEALAFKIDGKTLEERVSGWTEIVFPVEHGGRGSGSGMGFNGKWPSADKGNEKDRTTADFPARMNTKIGVNRTYDDMVKAFADTHRDADIEHGAVIDAYGYATKYLHGNAGSISGLHGGNSEIAIHNHPAGGWPTFSKEDVVNTALGTRRGIVAVSGTKGRSADTAQYAGTYSFVKGNRFNASGFVKAINTATLSGKDYNDAVNKWLKANQKKYGYKYSYSK